MRYASVSLLITKIYLIIQCYHCPTGHPAINGLSDLSKYYVTTDRGLIQHFNTNKEDTSDFDINSSFYFPNASITISFVSYSFLLFSSSHI